MLVKSLPSYIAPPVTCGVPSTPADGSFVGSVANTSPVGTLIHFRCDDGLFPMGNLSSVCGSDGVWSLNPEEIVCIVLPYTCMSAPLHHVCLAVCA